jgi:hypothetical protein
MISMSVCEDGKRRRCVRAGIALEPKSSSREECWNSITIEFPLGLRLLLRIWTKSPKRMGFTTSHNDPSLRVFGMGPLALRPIINGYHPVSDVMRGPRS